MQDGLDSKEEQVFELLEGGALLTHIAAQVGVDRSRLNKWIESDKIRSARAREARARASVFWEEKAESVIEAAADPFELARAKELAHHYRWKASKIAPKIYGDKVQTEHSGNVGIQVVTGIPRDGSD